jgi:hypothetical protein
MATLCCEFIDFLYFVFMPSFDPHAVNRGGFPAALDPLFSDHRPDMFGDQVDKTKFAVVLRFVADDPPGAGNAPIGAGIVADPVEDLKGAPCSLRMSSVSMLLMRSCWSTFRFVIVFLRGSGSFTPLLRRGWRDKPLLLRRLYEERSWMSRIFWRRS